MSIMSVRDMTPPRKEARGAGLGPRLTQLEALIREHRETSSEEDDLTVSDTLADHPIFRPCDQMLPYSIAAQATRIHLAPGEVLSTANGGPAYAVERGTVEVRVADGPPVLFGPGQVFNVVGFLGIAHEAEPFKPTGMDPTQVPLIKGHGGPYEIVQPAQVPRSLFAEKRGRQQLNVGPAPGQVCEEDKACFFALCPNAVLKMNPTPLSHHKMDGWLHVRAQGAKELPEEERNVDDAEQHPGGGARLVVLSMELVEKVGLCLGRDDPRAKTLRSALSVFKEHAQCLADRWRALITRCCTALPGVPPEVVWALAEQAEQRDVEAGEVFIQEGEEDEDLVLIEEGMAVVEKCVASTGRPSSVVIGKLRATAIIGDISLAGSSLPRPASVRATAFTEILRIPAAAVLFVAGRYPGALGGIAHRLKEVGNNLQMRLPMRSEVIESLDVFAGVEESFKKEVAAHGKRYVCSVGEIVADGTRANDSLYVLEHGTCCVEDCHRRIFDEVSSGSVFTVGSTVFGLSRFPGAVVRVAAPFAMIMEIQQKDLADALQRYYDKRPPPFASQPVPPSISLLHLVGETSIFSKVSSSFIEVLCASAQRKCYMQGQTLCVQSGQDKSQMFIIRGGSVLVEKDGRRTTESSTSYGDMMILGAEHQRPATVRAQTFVFTLEIPRSAFLEAIQKYPDERRKLENYALQAVSDDAQEGDQDGAMAIQWRMQKHASKRLGYLINLYAGSRLYDPADKEWKRLADECSALIVEGEAVVVNQDGEDVEVIRAGDTFNEQILLGIEAGAAVSGLALDLRSPCEIQFVSLAVWDKVVSDFPTEQSMIFRSIRDTMADKAAVKSLGHKMHSAEIVKTSRLLRFLSDAAIQDLKTRFQPVVVKPHSEIVTKGRSERAMYILLSGSVYVEEGRRRVDYGAGKVFGEAEMLGVSKAYNNTVYAGSLCVLAALSIASFWEVLQEHPEDCCLLEAVCFEEEGQPELDKLEDRIFRLPLASDISPEFMKVLCEHVEDAFFGPGEAILSYGEPCEYGQSDMFILLAGSVDVETELGIVQGHVWPGEVFGEGGAAIGQQSMRSASARSWAGAYVHCARIRGASIAVAFQKFPQEVEWFEDLKHSRTEANLEFMRRHNKWIQEKVVPALAAIPLFKSYADSFLQDLAAQLIDKPYYAGEVIVEKASQTDAMLVMLEGEAVVEAQNGSRIGRYGPNASLGEVAVLGLVDSHPARVRAATDCRVLPVKAAALSHALAMPNRRPEEREEINRLIEQRRSQVMEGIPMSALPIAISKEDVCSKAIALQADPTHLEPGGIWQPKADDSTAGPCFSVVTQGRALLEIASPNERLRRLGGDETPAVPVIPLEPGSLILEGIAAEFACRVRAISAVKVHRVRYVDFDIATRLESCSQDWLARFRMIENSTRRLLEDRGAAATGVVEALTDHAFKEDLEKYRERRKKALGVNFQQKLRSGGLVYDFSMMLPDKLGRMPHPAGDAFSKRAPCKIIARQLSAPAGLLSAAERRKLQAIQKWPRAYEHLSADFPDASGELLAEELWKSNGDKSAAEKKLREGPAAKAKRPSSQSRPLKLPLLAKSGASSAT